MVTHEERIKKLKIVAGLLGDSWFYNELLTEGHHGYFLSNKKGLYIVVRTVYRSKIEEWELCIKDAAYSSHYPSFGRIGCSLEKPFSSIISDLKNRLLCSESEAYKKMLKLAEEQSIKAALLENRKHVIDALKKVIPLDFDKNGCRGRENYDILNPLNEKIGAISHLDNPFNIDRFDLNLRGVSSLNIIKIMELIASK